MVDVQLLSEMEEALEAALRAFDQRRLDAAAVWSGYDEVAYNKARRALDKLQGAPAPRGGWWQRLLGLLALSESD